MNYGLREMILNGSDTRSVHQSIYEAIMNIVLIEDFRKYQIPLLVGNNVTLSRILSH